MLSLAIRVRRIDHDLVNKETAMQGETAHAEIDITGETCPMTFVRTRLALDRLASGQVLRIRMRGAEVLRNVPRNAVSQGHSVLSLQTDAEGVATLLLRRG